jgi:hypothetical protein
MHNLSAGQWKRIRGHTAAVTYAAPRQQGIGGALEKGSSWIAEGAY